ncbi:hypothetical protein WA158_007900 [Blastocystis sp. Blastoise]
MSRQNFPITSPEIQFVGYSEYNINPQVQWQGNQGKITPPNNVNPHSVFTVSFQYIIDIITRYTIYVRCNSYIQIDPSLILDGNLFDPKITDINKFAVKDAYKYIAGGEFSACFELKLGNDAVCVKVPKYDNTNIYAKKIEKREIEILSQLQHESIIKFRGVVVLDGNQSVESHSILFCGIFKKLAKAVGYAHSINIIHRDIKPSNVFMDKCDNPYLGDFGFARFLYDDTQDITHCGTALYAAPELFEAGKDYTNKCDIYSLGLVGYYIMTGKDIAESTFKENYEREKKDSNFKIKVDPYLNRVLYNLFNSCFSYDPEKRPTATEIVDILRTYNGKLYEDFH